MGWQFLWRSPTEQILEPAPNRPYDRNAGTAVLAETGETDSGSLTQAFTAEAQTPVTPLPPPTAPGSKPAIAKRQTQDKSKPPLDKMAAETGLLYDPNPGRADETDEFAHAQADNVGGLGDNSGDGVGVGVEYADPPQITDVTDPPIAVAAQGKVIEEKALETAESAPVEILQVPAAPLPPERVPVPQLSAEITYAEVQESPQTPIIYDPVIVPAPVPPPSPAPLPEINVILEKRTIPAPQAPAGPIVIGDAPVAYYPPEPPPTVITAPPPFEPRFDYDGRYVVQIASFRNVEAACAVWDDLRIDFPRLFDKAETIVRPHRTGSGALLHRLRVGAFSKRRYAVEWCQAYQEEGGECFVTRR